jgi:hypothetical protein
MSKGKGKGKPNRDTSKEACQRMLKDGKCSFGDKCWYSHDKAVLEAARKSNKSKLCTFFKEGKCKKGDKKCMAKNQQPAAPPESPPPPAHGLTGDFMAAHGLTHTGDMDVQVCGDGLSLRTHTCTRSHASALSGAWHGTWVPALRADVEVTWEAAACETTQP